LESIYCQNLLSLPEIAKKVIDLCAKEKIWVFKGEMGAGKTTLIKSIGSCLGIRDQISSPTFSIINEYQNENSDVFYHFDFYRIEEASTVLDLGIEEYFYSGNYCWIEWAEKIAEYIPEDFMLIKIEVQEEGERLITINQIKNGAKNG
jgi:tRNA threonylcarbamoyladenosine biosynthesis protein TsaE